MCVETRQFQPVFHCIRQGPPHPAAVQKRANVFPRCLVFDRQSPGLQYWAARCNGGLVRQLAQTKLSDKPMWPVNRRCCFYHTMRCKQIQDCTLLRCLPSAVRQSLSRGKARHEPAKIGRHEPKWLRKAFETSAPELVCSLRPPRPLCSQDPGPRNPSGPDALRAGNQQSGPETCIPTISPGAYLPP